MQVMVKWRAEDYQAERPYPSHGAHNMGEHNKNTSLIVQGHQNSWIKFFYVNFLRLASISEFVIATDSNISS